MSVLRQLCWFFAATLSLALSGAADAQPPAPPLPCAAWLATLSAGATTYAEREVLYNITRCDYSPSVILAAREQGLRAFLDRSDAGNIDVYLVHLEANHEGWIRVNLVPLLASSVVDKGRTTYFRGRLMLTLATELISHQTPTKRVYAPEPGEEPAGAARCTTGGSRTHSIPTRLLQPDVDRIRIIAQTMIADSTEGPQLRMAARCLFSAASTPDRSPY